MNLKKHHLVRTVVPVLALALAGAYFIPSKSSASTSTTLSGKCAGIQSTASFLLNTVNPSEHEVGAIGIIDFDTKTFYFVTSDEQARKNGTGSPTMALGKKSLPFFLHEGSQSGTYSGMWSMTFNNDPNAAEKIVLVPANSGNTIFMLDVKMGSTGVCQKI